MKKKDSDLYNTISKYLDMGLSPREISKNFPQIPYETIFLVYKEKIEKENFNLIEARKKYIKKRNVKIKKLFLKGVPIEEIAKSFNITVALTRRIINKIKTNHDEENDTIISKQILDFSKDRDKKIKKLLIQGYSFEEIAKSLDLTVLYVKNKFDKMKQDGIINETDIQEIYSIKQKRNNTHFTKNQNDDISR